jgi:hypothetical protein
VSASEEEEGREAKIREKIQPRYRWPAVSVLTDELSGTRGLWLFVFCVHSHPALRSMMKN